MTIAPISPMSLAVLYRAYIDCLNRQDWRELSLYVAEDVEHNGRRLGLSGYRDMLIRDFRSIPDLRFEIEILVCEPPNVAARRSFDCTPTNEFLGLRIDGRRLSFAENVFYEFENLRIRRVRSIIDKAAIEAQIRA